MSNNNNNNTTIVSLAPVNSSELFYGVECCLLNLHGHVDDSTSSSSSSSSDSDEEDSGILKIHKKNIPLISIRGWMHQSQGFKVFTNSTSFMSNSLDKDLESKKKSKSSRGAKSSDDSKFSAFEASIFPQSIRSVEALADTALKIVNASSSSSNLSSAHKKNIIWSNVVSDNNQKEANNNNNNDQSTSSVTTDGSSGKVSAATVIFAPIDQEFIFAVRVSTSHKTALNEKDVSEFADHALFALTTDVPLHTIIPTGWLSGSATATGRHLPISLRTFLSSSSSSSRENSNSKKCSRFLNDLKKRVEVCAAWWLQVKREERFLRSSTTLAETTSAALGAATDAEWIEKLHFALHTKFNLPFSVKVSPLVWTPSPSSVMRQNQRNPMNPRSESEADDDTRYVEDGWLIMHEKTVVGCTPLLDAVKRRALHHAVALVGSSVAELVSHIGELCAAPPPNPSGGGGGDPSDGVRLARPVIPPVVVFDVDVTSWLNSMSALEHQTSTSGADSTLQPFSPTTTSSYFHPTTTKIPGWNDTTANRQFVPPSTEREQRSRRHRVIVVTSAGGAFAPRGFSCAFFLSSSHVPFVGMPLALARDVARASLSDTSAMWDQYTEESSAQDQHNRSVNNNELRRLFDNHQVLLHAVMVATKNSGDYLIQGGSTSAIRTLLGPPGENSLDKTLDGSRKVNDMIAAAQAEIYTPIDLAKSAPPPPSSSSFGGLFSCCVGGDNNEKENNNNNYHAQLQKKLLNHNRNGLFHENVLRKLKEESGILSAKTPSRQVLTLKHPFFDKSSANASAQVKDTEKHVTRRIIAVISVDPVDENARVALFSVPMKNLTEHQCLHLGRILPM